MSASEAAFNDAYQVGLRIASIGKLVQMMGESTSWERKRGLRAAALWRLLSAGCRLEEASVVLG